jgi:hypothetical protein
MLTFSFAKEDVWKKEVWKMPSWHGNNSNHHEFEKMDD